MASVAHTLEEQVRRMTPVSATPSEKPQLMALSKVLEEVAKTPRPETKCELVGPKGESIKLPAAVFYVLERVVEVMARGDSLTVVPVGKELTTQQAADLLNVSRQYLVRLLEEGRLAFRRTGKHRRLKIEDVLAFKARRDSERRAGMRELSQLTEEYGGYEAEKQG